MTKGKKYENENYKKLFIFAATPSLSGRGGGGGLLQPPHPPTFFMAKLFENFFHRYMGIRTKGG